MNNSAVKGLSCFYINYAAGQYDLPRTDKNNNGKIKLAFSKRLNTIQHAPGHFNPLNMLNHVDGVHVYMNGVHVYMN